MASVTAALLLILLPLRIALASAPAVLPPVVGADGRLGLCDVLPGSVPSSAPGSTGPAWAQLAANAGARTNRWEFRWDQLQSQPGGWSFSADDAAVAASRQYGLDVLGVIDGIPGWATAPGQPAGNGVPRGLSRPISDPLNLWATFIRGLVTQYQGLVKYWEIWNEPDIHSFWNGNSGDYYNLLRVAYSVVRQVDPTAKVVLAGLVVPDLGFATKILDDSQRDVTSGKPVPFDIAAWHAYGPAIALYPNVKRLDGLMTDRGFGSIPVWVTEDGFPASNPAGEARQAAYVLQTITYALAAGAARILVYRASDDTTPKTWGLMDATGTARMAYTAYQVAAHFFSNTGAVSYAPTATLERFVLYKPNRRIIVVWSHGTVDQSVQVDASQPEASQIDWQGNVTPAPATGASLNIIAPGASYNAGVDPTGSVVGGPPVLVAENNTAALALPSAGYVAPLAGQTRTMILFNPSHAAVTAEVSAAGDPRKHTIVSLDPHAITLVDLDLLAGSDYTGMYAVSSSAPVVDEAASSLDTATISRPATNWYVPAAPASVAFVNQGSQPASVRVTAFGRLGKVLRRWSQAVNPQATLSIARNQIAGKGRASLSVQSNVPLIARDPSGRAVSRQATSWYAVGQRTASLAIFNPGSVPSRITIRFIGSSPAKDKRFRLAPHHSLQLATHGAMAISLVATSPVTLGGGGSFIHTASLQTRTATQFGLAANGATTRVVLYNPSARAAHVSLSVVTSAGTRRVARVVAPGKVYSLQARSLGGAPSGILGRSDVPVVAAPAG